MFRLGVLRNIGAMVCVIALTGMAMASETPFAGDWSGTGHANYAGEFEGACTSIRFVVEQTEGALSIKEGQFDCGLIYETWMPVHLVSKDGELFVQDRKVGTISESTVDVVFDNDPRFIWKWTLTLLNGRMHLDETFIQNLGDGSQSTSRTTAELVK